MSEPNISLPRLTFLPPTAARLTAPAPPAPAPPAPPTDLDVLLDSPTVATLIGKLKGGDTVTVTSDGKAVLEIHKEAVGSLDRFRSFARDALHATAREASNLVTQDPSFAFKEAALAVKSQVYAGMPADLTSMADQAFLPMIRVVSTAMDVAKAVKTWQSQHATKGDRIVDGSHLLTDAAGMGGAVAFALPGVGQGVAVALTTVGVVGDVAAYGYHVMRYFHDRAQQKSPARS